MNTALDPFALDNLEDPYDLYRRLRETAPIHEIDGMGLRLVSRQADVAEAAGRNDNFSSHITAFIQGGGLSGSEMVEMSGEAAGVVEVLATADPPDHTRQRKVVADAASTLPCRSASDDAGRCQDRRGNQTVPALGLRQPGP